MLEGVATEQLGVGDRSAREARPNWCRRPETGYASSAAFTTENADVAAAYARVNVLVYGPVPTLRDVLARIQEHTDLL